MLHKVNTGNCHGFKLYTTLQHFVAWLKYISILLQPTKLYLTVKLITNKNIMIINNSVSRYGSKR